MSPLAAVLLQVPPGQSMLAGRTTWPLWLAAAWVIGGVLALFSIWMSPYHSKQAKTVWTAIVVVPVLGPLGWFLLGRERRRSG